MQCTTVPHTAVRAEKVFPTHLSGLLNQGHLPGGLAAWWQVWQSLLQQG
jgi:hypothetical protein